MSSIIERIPELTDAQLRVLHDNATRLAEDGKANQRKAAAAVLQATQAEIDSRGPIAKEKPKPAPRRSAAAKPKRPREKA